MWKKRNTKKRVSLVRQIRCKEIPKPYHHNGLEIWCDKYTALYIKPLTDEFLIGEPPKVLLRFKPELFQKKEPLPKEEDLEGKGCYQLHPQIYVNARYLRRIMQIFPEAETFSWTGKKNEAIFIGGKDGYAILLPLNYDAVVAKLATEN